MPDRTTLARLGKLVAADVAVGQPGPNSQAASRFLEAQPEAALDLLDMLLGEAGKKRRNEKLMTAYGFMFGQALEFTRYAVEGGFVQAAALVDAVRERLLSVGKDGQVEAAVVLMVLREFTSAKLDPGLELRALMNRLADGMATMSAPGPEGIKGLDTYLEDLTRQVDGDPFALHAEVSEMAGAFPDHQRAAIGAWLLQASEEAAREAALGWLLDASPSVRNSTASGIEHAAATGGVSGVTLRRLIAIRNWLPEADRLSVDRTIQTCRRKGVEISPWPQPQVREVLASGIDGAGAQSVFVLGREGRRNAIACLLVKHGIGIRDAWARHGLTRAEWNEFLGQIEEIDLLPISLDHVRIAAAHALAVNLGSGVMPPFAMLDVMETAGLQGLQPEALSADAVLSLLEAEAAPALLRAEVVKEILASSRHLPGEFEFLASWFEADTEVEQLLASKKLSRAKRRALVQDELLPRRRTKWVERLAWTALTLRHGEEDEPWEAFFVSARELAAGRPVGEIPLMAHVVALTVDAYTATHSVGPSRPANQRR